MTTKTIYSKFDLKKGKCKCCGEKSSEILIEDGRCIDCIEEEKFIKDKRATQRSPYGMWT